jgi:hypothetical protein
MKQLKSNQNEGKKYRALFLPLPASSHPLSYITRTLCMFLYLGKKSAEDYKFAAPPKMWRLGDRAVCVA